MVYYSLRNFIMECHMNKLKWTLYSSCAAIFIFFSFSDVSLLSSVKNAIFSPSSHPKYVIVLDGGSTGTRIHVFSFENNTNGFVTLQDEYFQETKPGLSNFASAPKNAALSVQSLLEKAKSYVPSQKWYDTPIVLKATAGLRLLPAEKSNSILREVSDLFLNSPFHSEENSVSILDSEDEGIFAWFTVNFLLDHLKQPSQTVALLDLGGGSTQVSFAPVDLDSIVLSPRGFITNRKVNNHSITLYTHSYLGFGLMSARFSILNLTSDTEDVKLNEKHLRSACIPPNTEVNWLHAGVDYTVTGLKSGTYGFAECYNKVTSFLSSTIHRPTELWKREVYGISYYFDRAVDMNIINKKGGVITVGDFVSGAVDACSKKSSPSPFLCLDATYISGFLHHGLGFSKEKEIKLLDQIDGKEASWGLGAAFSILK